MPQDTLLHKAAHNGDLRQVTTLIEEKNADVNAPGASDRRALHRAAGGNHGAVVEYLLRKGADANAVDGNGRTPLHWAAINGHVDPIALLLTEGGANVLLKTNTEMTPLHASAGGGHADVCRTLVEHTAGEIKVELFNCKNANGKTAAVLAKDEKHKEVLAALRECGDPNAKSSGGSCSVS